MCKFTYPFYFTLLFCFTFSLSSLCQEYLDLGKIEYATSTPNEFDTGMAETPFWEMNADITLPIVISEKAAFLTGVTYESISAQFNPNRAVETVTGITLKLGSNIQHNSQWSGTYLLLPKISSDLKQLGRNDFQIGGVALIKYEKTSRFNYRFGAYFNQELFGPFLVPMFGLYYLAPGEKLELKLLLPLAGNLTYKIGTHSSLGLNYKGQIRSYNLNTPYFNETERYLARSTNEATGFYQYAFGNGLNLQVGVARTIARHFRAYTEKVDFALPLLYFGDNRTQLNTDFSDNWMFKFSVFYRLYLRERPN